MMKFLNKIFNGLRFVYFVIIFIFFVAYIFISSDDYIRIRIEYHNEKVKNASWGQWLQETNFTEKEQPEYDKFIFTSLMMGRLGNQLYRYAALYSIGKLLNRTPVFLHDEAMLLSMTEELKIIFPNFHKRIYFLRSDFNEFEKISLSSSCCDYQDPKILLDKHTESRGLMFIGSYNFEHYQYFHHMRNDILEIFAFNEQLLIANISTYRARLMKHKSTINGSQPAKSMVANPQYWMEPCKGDLDSNGNNICVHTRMGDFISYGESRLDQIANAIDFMIHRLTSERNNKFSILFFGDDTQFQRNVTIVNEMVQEVIYISEANISRGHEMLFAKKICHSFLLTAPLSSFGFWMAYLMTENQAIFYIRKIIFPEPNHVDTYRTLPSKWYPIAEEWLNQNITRGNLR